MPGSLRSADMCGFVPKSQNHGTVWVGRDLEDHLGPTPATGSGTLTGLRPPLTTLGTLPPPSWPPPSAHAPHAPSAPTRAPAPLPPPFPLRRARAWPSPAPGAAARANGAAAAVNPWRGGAARAEQEAAAGGRRRRRQAGGARSREPGAGSRALPPPGPLPSARCGQRAARRAPVTAARPSEKGGLRAGERRRCRARPGGGGGGGSGAGWGTAATAAAMMPMILTVFLSNNEQILTEVPITPETTCRDVVEFCKEPGEGSCHLAEVWRGNERPIPFDHMMYDHLQKWGPRREEVKFFLRHEESPAESNEQSGRQAQNQRNGINIPVEKRTENGRTLADNIIYMDLLFLLPLSY
uniref:Protein phosphatase 1 regulatory subunit 13B n=1 Tax=Anser brachyrhynchus TaxID=132585 RepID=A0A8B9I6Y4_9AVES